MKRRYWAAAVLGCLVVGIWAIPPAVPPFKMVQVCLGDLANVGEFKAMFRSIAEAEGMRFIDASESTQRDFERMKQPYEEPLTNIALRRNDMSGLSAGSSGMPRYQVAIGFSAGRDAAIAHAFAERVVKKLSARWPVQTVPAGEGAQGMKDCKVVSD